MNYKVERDNESLKVWELISEQCDSNSQLYFNMLINEYSEYLYEIILLVFFIQTHSFESLLMLIIL